MTREIPPVVPRKKMFTLLVPTERRSDGKPIRTRFHRVWDEKVRAISGGLTILPPVKGQWLSPTHELFKERMIPVSFIATEDEKDQIVAMTAEYYDQLAIHCWEISSNVTMYERKGAPVYEQRTNDDTAA